MNKQMSKSKPKISLKNNKTINKIWHPESTLVFKSSKEKIVIGRCEEGELIQLDDKSLDLCSHWKFKYDTSLVEEEEVTASDEENEHENSEYDNLSHDEHTESVTKETEKPEPETEKYEPDTEKPEPDTEKPEPETEKYEPDTEKPEPDTEKPEPETEKPEPLSVPLSEEVTKTTFNSVEIVFDNFHTQIIGVIQSKEKYFNDKLIVVQKELNKTKEELEKTKEELEKTKEKCETTNARLTKIMSAIEF